MSARFSTESEGAGGHPNQLRKREGNLRQSGGCNLPSSSRSESRYWSLEDKPVHPESREEVFLLLSGSDHAQLHGSGPKSSNGPQIVFSHLGLLFVFRAESISGWIGDRLA